MMKLTAPLFLSYIASLGAVVAMLPDPNHVYPVPDVDDLKAELHQNGGVILRLATFTRSLTIGANWFLASPPYGWFYTLVTTLSSLFPRFKKASAS